MGRRKKQRKQARQRAREAQEQQQQQNSSSDEWEDGGDDDGSLCGHLSKAVRMPAVHGALKGFGKGAFDTSKKGRPCWLCLLCGDVSFGESPKMDFSTKEHLRGKHCVGLDLESGAVWCATCDLVLDDTNVLKGQDRLLETQQLHRDALERRPPPPPPPADTRNKHSDSNNDSDDGGGGGGGGGGDDGAVDVPVFVKGLRNLGNTCFMNSVLQCVAQTAPLQQALLRPRHRPDLPLQGALRSVLCDMVSVGDGGGGKKGHSVVNPSAVLKAVSKNNRRFRGGRQQDAHELLRALLDGMREEEIQKQVERRRREVFDALVTWTEEDVWRWMHSLGLEQYDAIYTAFHISGAPFTGELLVSLIAHWTTKQAKRIRKRFHMRQLADRVRFTEAVAAIRRGAMPRLPADDDGDDAAAEKKEEDDEGFESFVDDIWLGTFSNTVTCAECGCVSTTRDSFFDVSLPVQPPALLSWQESLALHQSKKGNNNNKHKSRKNKNKSKSQSQRRKKNKPLTKAMRKRLRKEQQRREAQEGPAVTAARAAIDAMVANAVHQAEEKKTEEEEEEKEEEEEEKEEEKEAAGEANKAEEEAKNGFHLIEKSVVTVDDCLAAFVHPEFLTGPDKYGCDACTRKEEEKVRNKNNNNNDDDDDNGGKVEEGHDDDGEGDDDEEADDDFTVLEKRTMVKRDAHKQMTIQQAPEILSLHLKRFEETYHGPRKVDKAVKFGMELDLRPFLVESTGPPVPYRLFGVVVHSGGIGGGHYIAYVRKGDAWFYFSDAHCQPVSAAQVLGAQAYLLFYERTT